MLVVSGLKQTPHQQQAADLCIIRLLCSFCVWEALVSTLQPDQSMASCTHMLILNHESTASASYCTAGGTLYACIVCASCKCCKYYRSVEILKMSTHYKCTHLFVKLKLSVKRGKLPDKARESWSWLLLQVLKSPAQNHEGNRSKQDPEHLSAETL